MKKQIPSPGVLALKVHEWGDKPAERRGDVVSKTIATVISAFFVVFFVTTFVLPSGNTSLAAESALGNSSAEVSSILPVDLPSEKTTSECPLTDNLEGYEGSWDRVLSYCSTITSTSEKYGIDPEIIAAIILMESGGDSSAISVSGAVGLMQIMPSDGYAATFVCANGPCFSDRPSTAELLDPSFNINYGTKLLSRYVSSYGSLREGLYHYGPLDYEGYADKIISLAESLSKE